MCECLLLLQQFRFQLTYSFRFSVSNLERRCSHLIKSIYCHLDRANREIQTKSAEGTRLTKFLTKIKEAVEEVSPSLKEMSRK